MGNHEFDGTAHVLKRQVGNECFAVDEVVCDDKKVPDGMRVKKKKLSGCSNVPVG